MSEMTAEQRAAIRARLAAATPGPWASDVDDETGVLVVDFGSEATAFTRRVLFGDMEDIEPADHATAEFIAHAPEDIAALLDALEAAEGRVTALRAALGDYQAAQNHYNTCDDCQEVHGWPWCADSLELLIEADARATVALAATAPAQPATAEQEGADDH